MAFGSMRYGQANPSLDLRQHACADDCLSGGFDLIFFEIVNLIIYLDEIADRSFGLANQKNCSLRAFFHAFHWVNEILVFPYFLLFV